MSSEIHISEEEKEVLEQWIKGILKRESKNSLKRAISLGNPLKNLLDNIIEEEILDFQTIKKTVEENNLPKDFSLVTEVNRKLLLATNELARHKFVNRITRSCNSSFYRVGRKNEFVKNSNLSKAKRFSDMSQSSPGPAYYNSDITSLRNRPSYQFPKESRNKFIKVLRSSYSEKLKTLYA